MHILIIEDNRDLVENLCDFLEAKGHTVDVAYDGLGGLRLGREQLYDGIVLDLMLPRMSGVDVCRRLREEGRDVPVLMLTARDTLDDKLVGFESGTDDYLVKPFSLQELEVRLSALARRARGGYARRLQVGDLVLEPQTRRVSRGGRDIELPPIPLKILELLMRHSPKVVSRARIEREVWGDSPPDSDALRRHTHLLRQAVDKPFESPLLATIRGIGYRLAESGGKAALEPEVTPGGQQ